jgi:hypothetical protein
MTCRERKLASSFSLRGGRCASRMERAEGGREKTSETLAQTEHRQPEKYLCYSLQPGRL